MHPERAFVISTENKQRIKELLLNLQKEKLVQEDNEGGAEPKSMRGARVIESFTNMLFEALQFVNIIPNVMAEDLRREIDEVRGNGDAFN